MKKVRTLRRAFGIVFGAVGFAGGVSSCTKARDCNCTYDYTYTDGTSTVSGSYTYTVMDTVVKKCSELDQSLNFTSGSYTYDVTVTCTKK